MQPFKRLASLLLGILVWCGGAAAAQEPFELRNHYIKSELMIPMRDGVQLFTQIYEPLDAEGPLPMMLFRTPYSIGFYGDEIRRGSLGPSPIFGRSKYIFVYQDVRGKFHSEGDFEVMMPVYSKLEGSERTDEVTDTYDTIEWIIENVPDHNGCVGQWGISYPGWQTVMGMIDAHPALKASSPQASPADMFIGDDFHHNGAFRFMYTFGWLAGNAATRASGGVPIDFSRTDGYDFYLQIGPVSNVDRLFFHERVPTWNEYMEHGIYDQYWKRQDVLQHMRDIAPAVLHVAGWFDAEDFYGPMEIYDAIEERDDPNDSTLVVGPWRHGGWSGGTGSTLGDARFGQDTSVFYRNEVEFPFFEHHLKGAADPELPEALVFETGLNEWRRYDQWPPTEARAANLYLHAGGRLSFEPPTAGDDPGHDAFESDPAKPVPFSANVGMAQGHTWMVEDQRFVAGRDDVLIYRTDVLTEDVVVAGPIIASLQVSTTGTDADWIVKLIDEHPADLSGDPLYAGSGMGGFQMLVGADVIRAKFRNSFEFPEPLVPDEVTTIEWDLRDKYHRFRKGHRIQVQIQSSWFPVIDRNPQKFVDIYHAEEEDFQTATHRVHRTPEAASHLKLLLVPVAESASD